MLKDHQKQVHVMNMLWNLDISILRYLEVRVIKWVYQSVNKILCYWDILDEEVMNPQGCIIFLNSFIVPEIVLKT